MILHKAMWSDKVSLILFILFVFAGTGYFTKDLNATPILFIAALNIVYHVREKYLFALNLLDKHEDVAAEMGISTPRKRKRTLMANIIVIIILSGFVVGLGFIGYTLIFP